MSFCTCCRASTGAVRTHMVMSLVAGALTGDDVSCRFCGGPLIEFIDLGMSPLSDYFLAKGELNAMEAYYPLAAWVCRDCFLVQLQEYVAPKKIFTEYAYYSSFSETWR